MPTTELAAVDEKKSLGGKGPDSSHVGVGAAEDVELDESLRPTEEELLTLRKISAPLP